MKRRTTRQPGVTAKLIAPPFVSNFIRIALRIARTPHSPLGIVATAREVVQEESRTYSEMTRCVRLFHNTLFPCGSLTHGEVAVSEDALSGHQRIRFSIPTASNFHERPRNGMGADCLK
jgi:hypothetical protein